MATDMKEYATVNDDNDNTEYVPSSPQNNTTCLPSEDADDYNEGVEKIVQLMEKLSIDEMSALKILIDHFAEKDNVSNSSE